ncbi:TAFII28-domain-containing protein [Wilcoxina mikolae CBS 423.85]|nr:TAFII28-domain-containing protein [Wilcoxina mikolae CBS 423.85]
MAILLEAFDASQNARYESFRRANLNKAAVKKLANSVLSQSVTANVGTVICGFSKVFTGEIIELALKIQRSWGDEGPLLPDHLREAWRRYRIERHGAIGYRGAIGGGSPVATGPGPGMGDVIGGGVGRLFR